MVLDGKFNQIWTDTNKNFEEFVGIAPGKIAYDNKGHILFLKSEILKDNKKTIGIAASILSNYGSVQLAFYTQEMDFYAASNDFNQIVNSFNFDNGYQYFEAQEKRRNWIKILPESLPAKALLLMAIFLYGRYFHWRKFKETRVYFIKFIIVIALAEILDLLFAFFSSTNLNHEFISGLGLLLTVCVAVFWYKEYKKTKKEPSSASDGIVE